MPQKRFFQIFKDLSFEKKLIAGGAILLVLSLFLPWYQDLDTFHTGDTFTGITGPMYLAGLTFLVIASTSLLFLVMSELGLRLPFAALRSPRIYLHYGIFSFYLLMVVNSIYFHRNFGVNITLKQSGFGTFTAFIAASLLTIGGYLATRQKKEILKAFQDEVDEVNEPLVPSLQQKPKENLRTMAAEQAQNRPVQTSQPQGTVVRGSAMNKGSGTWNGHHNVGGSLRRSTAPHNAPLRGNSIARSTGENTRSAEAPTNEKTASDSAARPQTYRMDL